MTKFKRIMVGLDLTKTDKNVVKYASFICSKLKPEVVYFVHVKKPYTIPLILSKNYPGTLEEITRKMLGELNKVVKENFTCRGVKKEVTLLDGSPLQELLSFSYKKKIDLIVVGRKSSEGGLVPERLSRKANCSVLFVPERAKPGLSKIHVPVDLSEHSKIALDAIGQLTGASKGSTVFCQNVLYFPVYPVSIGNTKSEFSGEVSEELKDKVVKFIEKYGKGNSKFEVVFSLTILTSLTGTYWNLPGRRSPI